MSLPQEMARAATAWLGSLSEDQRAIGQHPGPEQDNAERTTWFYTPTDHGGLPLNQERPGQQGLAMQLLATGLSPAGYATVTTVMGLENVLDRLESWSRDWGRERGRDPGLYYLRVFGLPGDGTWGWRFGGHHISVNYTLVGGRIASFTPCFIGAQPAETALLGEGTLKPLGGIEGIGRDLARGLEQRGEERAVIHRSAISDIVSGNRARIHEGDEMIHMQDLWRGRFTDGRLSALVDQVDVVGETASGYGAEDHRRLALTAQPKGIPGGALTSGELEGLLGLVESYLGRFPDEIAEPRIARYRGGGLERLHFAYAGERSPSGPVYYRLQDQSLLIEYDNTQSGANHAHSVVRDLAADFGLNALAEHRKIFHAPEPDERVRAD
jgi:hypothetical protein